MTGNSMIAAQAGISTDHVRNLGQLVLDSVRLPATSDLVDQGVSIALVDQTIAALNRSLVPAKRADPNMENPSALKLRDALGLIGRKIRPEASPSAAKDWVAALMVALSDLPYRISVPAAQAAIHSPFEFLNQVEIAIRAEGKRVAEQMDTARLRLNRIRAEIMNPPPKALPKGEPIIWDRAHIDEMARTEIGQSLLGIGFAKGWIAKDENGAFCPVQKQEDLGL